MPEGGPMWTGCIPRRRNISVLCHRLLSKWRQHGCCYAWRHANVLCWLLNSNRAYCSCCGWVIYYQAVQLSAMTNFDNLNQSTQARIKNCKLFGKISFVCSSHACTREFLGWALTMLRVVQAYLKHCPSLCEAVVKTKLWSKSLLYSATNKFAYASIERCTRSTQAVFVFFALLLHA